MKPWLKNRGDKSACANIFLELPLITNSSIMFEWMEHHTIDHTLTFIHSLLIHLVLLAPIIMHSEAADLQACNFNKKRLLHRGFPVKFAKFLRTTILKSICERLLLCVDYFIIFWFLQFTTVHVFHFCK